MSSVVNPDVLKMSIERVAAVVGRGADHSTLRAKVKRHCVFETPNRSDGGVTYHFENQTLLLRAEHCAVIAGPDILSLIIPYDLQEEKSASES